MARRSVPVPPPAVTRVRDWGAQADRLRQLLLAGDELGARALVDRVHRGDSDCLQLCENLITPAMRDIGDDWAAGRISVAHEHRASAICERLLGRAAPHPRGRPRGVAVVCTPPGEDHGLPAMMAAMALRADRWKVHHLGPDVPIDDLVAFAKEVDADLVVLSTVVPDARMAAARVAERLDDVRVLVGGPGQSLRDLRERARELRSLPPGERGDAAGG